MKIKKFLSNKSLGRSNSPCPLDGVDTRSENSKWRIRRKEEKSKEISVDDLINNFPSVWQMQGILIGIGHSSNNHLLPQN